MVLNSFLLTIVLLGFSFFSSAKGTEEMAKKLFEEQKYAEALSYYEELNTLNPNEENYQYYYGVCLTQTNSYSTKTRKLLLQSSKGNVPVNVMYYIGVNYHAINDFATASWYYQRYAEYARKKELNALNFDEIVKQCEAGINPFSTTISASVKEEIHFSDSVITQALAIDTPTLTIKPAIATLPIDTTYINQTSEVLSVDSVRSVDSVLLITTPTNIITDTVTHAIDSKKRDELLLNKPYAYQDTTFNFILTSDIRYQIIDQFKTESGKAAFIIGLKNSNQLDQILYDLEQIRNNYENVADDEKLNLALKALDMEMETLRLKTEIDKNYLEAREAEMDFWNNAPLSELKKLKSTNDSIQNIKKIETPKEQIIETFFEADSMTIEVDTIDIVENSPPFTGLSKQIIYKVQIGAFSQKLPDYIDRLYKKLAVLRKIDKYTDDRGVVVYTVGELTNQKDALKLQNQIRQEGVKDAFVVAYNNGKRITLKEAKEITKE